MSSDANPHPFDVAADADERVNDMLADTDGSICTMEYAGAIGYHVHVASGEADPEYLWKIALLEALNESVFEMLHVDADTPRGAREQIQRELSESFDPFTAEYVADLFEEKLAALIDVQEEHDGGDSE